MRQRLVAQVSQRRFANQSGFDAPIGVVWHGRSVDHISKYSGRQIASDLRNLHELRGKRLVAQVSQTRRFALYSRTGVVLMLQLESPWHGRSVDHISTYSGRQIASDLRNLHELRGKRFIAGFDAPIGVVLAWEERGSCLNIFRMTNHVGSQKPSRITRQQTCSESESNTSIRDGFDAPIGVVFAWKERGSCHNLFRMTNPSRISETFTNYEAKDLLRKSVDHVSTYSGQKIPVGSQKPSRITAKDLLRNESNTSVHDEPSGFHDPIGVVLAWGSVDHVSTYSERQVAVGSQIPSRITRQKTCSASELNTSVPNGFDAPIGVVLAWEERGSCLNLFGRKIPVGSQKPSRITRQKTCCASKSNTSFREPEWF
ncbi:uncharacterized protein G2W53_033629 [Senna tora]|uniref:Uncharacterized protein n=1 Tax=Senna tora TaxID=362788 RepID=A0A834SZJ1_9FABA|nr:uncharacterized protein G2W53_033629 [Senna tora]